MPSRRENYFNNILNTFGRPRTIPRTTARPASEFLAPTPGDTDEEMTIDIESALRSFLNSREATFGRDIRFIKLVDPTGKFPRPPLDAIDTTERFIIELKTTQVYTMSQLDRCRYGGVAVPEWKFKNMDLACGFRSAYQDSMVRENCFESAWMIQLDSSDDVYRLSYKTMLELRMHSDNGLPWRDDELVKFKHDQFNNNSPYPAAYYFPSKYWSLLGNLGTKNKPRSYAPTLAIDESITEPVVRNTGRVLDIPEGSVGSIS